MDKQNTICKTKTKMSVQNKEKQPENELHENEKYDIKMFLLIKKVYMKFLGESTAQGNNPGFAVFAEAMDMQKFYSQQELSDFVGCNKAHTSRTLLKMHVRGLTKPNLTLTDKGKIFAENIKKAKQEFSCALLKDVSKAETETFLSVLDKILKNAKRLEAEGGKNGRKNA